MTCEASHEEGKDCVRKVKIVISFWDEVSILTFQVSFRIAVGRSAREAVRLVALHLLPDGEEHVPHRIRDAPGSTNDTQCFLRSPVHASPTCEDVQMFE